nr:2-dehydro-3-deoxygalactonokinase [uncultured Shimia sp.]
MTNWIAADKQGRSVRMWQMPSRQEVETADDPIVMVGSTTVAARSLPCAAVPDALIRGDAGGWQMSPFEWDGDHSAGAEACIAGYASENANWDGVICVVRDSTVWAHVSAGEVISFQRFVTSTLAAALNVADQWDQDRFLAALSDAMSRPERLAAHLAKATQSSDLWGALLGAELTAARPYWLGQQVVVIGQGRGASALGDALQTQGVPVEFADETDMFLTGLAAAVSAQGGVA